MKIFYFSRTNFKVIDNGIGANDPKLLLFSRGIIRSVEIESFESR